MKIRLSGDETRRLRALVDNHDELTGIDQAVRFCIELVTDKIYKDTKSDREAWDRRRTEEWAKKKAAAKQPVRRARPRNRSEMIAPAAYTPRRDSVRELVEKYVHDPAPPTDAQRAGLERRDEAARDAANYVHNPAPPTDAQRAGLERRDEAAREEAAARDAAKADKDGEGARE